MKTSNQVLEEKCSGTEYKSQRVFTWPCDMMRYLKRKIPKEPAIVLLVLNRQSQIIRHESWTQWSPEIEPVVRRAEKDGAAGLVLIQHTPGIAKRRIGPWMAAVVLKANTRRKEWDYTCFLMPKQRQFEFLGWNK